MHRTFAILQFVIFGTMATFTSNFSIFSGILPDDSQTPVNPVQFQLSNVTFNDVFATGLRQEHLPVLNARGISLVMAFSRLLLLSQYLLGLSLQPTHPFIVLTGSIYSSLHTR